jgi:AraC-like DNA-binding protein
MLLSILVLVFNKGHKSSNRFLAGVLFFSALFSLVNFAIFFGKSVFWVAIFETSFNTVFFLIGPLSYFYVRSVLRDNSKLSKWDYLHFLIYFILFTGTIRFVFTSWDHKLEVAKVLISNETLSKSQRIQDFLPSFINNGIRPFHLAVYVIANWILIFKFKANLKERYLYTYQFKLMRNWLFCFNILLTANAIFISIIIFNLFVYSNNEEFLNRSYYFFFLLSAGYTALNIVLLAFPQIMYGLPFESVYQNRADYAKTTNEPILDIMDEEESDPVDIIGGERKLPQFYSSLYIRQIEDLLENAKGKKEYLHPEFSIDHIQADSNIPIHHISFYFNNIAQVKFTEWRNLNRIEHAIELMNKDVLNSVNFKWIATKAGFSTQSTFIRAFKSHTGYSPSEYLVMLYAERVQ